MRILILDWFGGDGMLDYVLRCKHWGHTVKWHFKRQDRTKDIGKGLTDIVDDWRGWMRWADLVVLADNTHYLREVDSWRKEEHRIVGATVESAKWELDRKTGMGVFEKAGIPVPEYKEFTDCATAIKFVEKECRGFVAKPCYDEADKNLTYLGRTPEALISMLRRWQKEQRMKGPFILQELVDGIEMAVGAWFGPNGFSEGWLEGFEEKKLMAGGLGPSTGEMGTPIRYVKKSKLADKVLAPLEEAIARTGHVGYVDVNCLIDEKGTPWPLEFTMRNGYPTFNIQQDLHDGDPAEWLLDLAEGRDAKCFVYDEMAIGVCYCQGDFPWSKLPIKEVSGFPIYGLDTLSDGVHLCQAQAGEAPVNIEGDIATEGCALTAGDYILIASGTGATVRAARAKAYAVLDKIKMPNGPFWRIDIGKRLQKELPKLAEKGYALDWTY